MPLIQEILSQLDAARAFLNNQQLYHDALDAERIRASNQTVFLIGEGSSLSALHGAAWLLHKGYRQMLNVYRIPASDLRFTDITDAIVLVCSNSGNTAEIKQNIEEGYFDGAKLVIGLTNYKNSALGQ